MEFHGHSPIESPREHEHAQGDPVQERTLETVPALVERGLARIENGRLKALPSAFRTLERAQADFRSAQRQNGTAKNIHWSGPLMLCVAKHVADAVSEGRAIGTLSVVRDLYRNVLLEGFHPTVRQFQYGLSLFHKVSSAGEVYEIVATHKSYGAWWSELSPADRKKLIERRKQAWHETFLHLTPDAVACRRRLTESAQQTDARRLESEAAPRLERKIRTALDISAKMKALEDGTLPGSTYAFPGVAETMRSSWEAMYARIVRAQPGRHCVYEPMGFPLVTPNTGRVEAYHPDFFEYKSTPTGGLRVRVVEIKGVLTETGQRKIGLFIKYYLNEDFTGLAPDQARLQMALMRQTKTLARRQFHVTFGPELVFRVFGKHCWDYERSNFVVNMESKRGDGLIPRLERRFPDFVYSGKNASLSNREVEREFTNLSHGQEKWVVVRPIQKPHIDRSSTLVAPESLLVGITGALECLEKVARRVFAKERNDHVDLSRFSETSKQWALAAYSWPSRRAAQKDELLVKLRTAADGNPQEIGLPAIVLNFFATYRIIPVTEDGREQLALRPQFEQLQTGARSLWKAVHEGIRSTQNSDPKHGVSLSVIAASGINKLLPDFDRVAKVSNRTFGYEGNEHVLVLSFPTITDNLGPAQFRGSKEIKRLLDLQWDLSLGNRLN